MKRWINISTLMGLGLIVLGLAMWSVPLACVFMGVVTFAAGVAAQEQLNRKDEE